MAIDTAFTTLILSDLEGLGGEIVRMPSGKKTISMRLPEADIAMIDRAANLRGRSRTDFVREAAVRAAEDMVMEARLLRMSPAGFAEFMAAVSAPATAILKWWNWRTASILGSLAIQQNCSA